MSTSASPEVENRPTSHLPTKVFKGHTKPVLSVAYFSDGKRVISGSDDKTIRVWNVESGKQEWQSLEQDGKVKCISISPDERTLAVCGMRRVVMWNLESKNVVWTTEEMVDGWRVAFSPDGQLIAATADEDIILLDAETGKRITEPLPFGELLYCLAFSPDTTQLAAGSEKGKVRVFDVATGEAVLGPIHAHSKRVTSALFTPDGKQIITASGDKSIRVWDGSTGIEVGDPMLGHESFIQQIALSHDGRRLASVDNAMIRVWDQNTRRQLGDSLPVEAKYWFYSIAWSPDGRSIVTGHHEGRISLWDVAPLEIENSDTTTAPINVVEGNPPRPSSSRPRTGSLSSSLLDSPAAGPSNQSKSNQPPHRDDFWDTSDIDLPARARPQISTIPIAEVPLKPSIPRTSNAKTAPNVSSTSSAAPSANNNLLGRIGAHFRRDQHAPDAIEMQPPPPKIPKYSPVAKVALGQADARLYMDTSKDKKPGDDESGQEEWADVEVNCWDIFRAMFTSCCTSRSDSG
ncbi:quinon protein alcohol dehydrogenase-like superfamily [Hygrophoropsis aurantiaca]|uniref:Quinon protein alcohol dehydrogenase-like superfamily n=1 Tax=Hygrophoropsis aurantiaca TaxID=72124 RepID=A0ACB7ZTB6_9AGAM|nr:quinon protein alcohol dehydrogenase-like superfamily [Hygrophoropsis aurantiaca]